MFLIFDTKTFGDIWAAFRVAPSFPFTGRSIDFFETLHDHLPVCSIVGGVGLIERPFNPKLMTKSRNRVAVNKEACRPRIAISFWRSFQEWLAVR